MEKIAVLYDQFSISFTYENERLEIRDIENVDENFFKMFPPIVICGSLDDDLFLEKEIADMVVTEDFARKFFNTPEEALGKMFISTYKTATS